MLWRTQSENFPLHADWVIWWKVFLFHKFIKRFDRSNAIIFAKLFLAVRKLHGNRVEKEKDCRNESNYSHLRAFDFMSNSILCCVTFPSLGEFKFRLHARIFHYHQSCLCFFVNIKWLRQLSAINIREAGREKFIKLNFKFAPRVHVSLFSQSLRCSFSRGEACYCHLISTLITISAFHFPGWKRRASANVEWDPYSVQNSISSNFHVLISFYDNFIGWKAKGVTPKRSF